MKRNLLSNGRYERKTMYFHFFYDGNYRKQGEYKEWHDIDHSLPKLLCFYKDGLLHGEYKEWDANGNVIHNCIYIDDLQHHMPTGKMGNEEKLKLTLKHDLRWLS